MTGRPSRTRIVVAATCFADAARCLRVGFLFRALQGSTEIFDTDEWARAVRRLVTLLAERAPAKSVLAAVRRLPVERIFGGSPRIEAFVALLPLASNLILDLVVF